MFMSVPERSTREVDVRTLFRWSRRCPAERVPTWGGAQSNDEGGSHLARAALVEFGYRADMR